LNAPDATIHRRISASQQWAYIAIFALSIALAAGGRWLIYKYDLHSAQRAYTENFRNTVEPQFKEPFYGISAQIDLQKWFSGGAEDVVAKANLVALNETISLTLQPKSTGYDCSPSNITQYQVLLDAPGFTTDIIGASLRSRKALIDPVCSVSKVPPPAAPSWRWNLTATQPGDHVITILFEALGKNQQLYESRLVDIPVTIPKPPEPFSAYVGVGSGIVTILAGLFGLWTSWQSRPHPSA
jgi:hypothetical protein